MVEHFTPTDGTLPTFKNAFGYMRHNLPLFWSVLKNYLPYFLAAQVIGLAVGLVIRLPELTVALMNAYVLTFFAIQWHRLIIQGPDQAHFINPIKPDKPALIFFGFSFASGLVAGLVGALSAAILMKVLGGFAGGILSLLIVGVILWAICRLSFVYPTLAITNILDVKGAFAATKGYVQPLILNGALIAIIALVPSLIVGAVMSPLYFMTTNGSKKFPDTTMEHIAKVVMELPTNILLMPLFTALGVTVLSNFYLRARAKAAIA